MMIFEVKSYIFLILGVAFVLILYAKIQSAVSIPKAGVSVCLRTKFATLKWSSSQQGTVREASWTLSLLYTSADKYKSLEFYEKLLTLITCNFLSFGN